MKSLSYSWSMVVLVGVTACAPSVDEFVIPVPQQLALSTLSESTLDTLRAEVTIEGVLSASPLEINRQKNLAMGTFTIPNQKVQDALIQVDYYAALDADAQEVLVARNQATLTLKKGQLNKPNFGAVTTSGSLEFDVNRNDKSNLEDLVAGIDPAPQANPIVVTPETLSFESGIDVGSYSRTFFVVSNQSTESTSLDFDVRLAPGVTVAPLENLLDIASPVAGESFSLDLGPGDEKVMALTFAPTNALFVVGGLIVAAQMGDSDVKHQSFLRIIGNPNGAVPQPPSGYTIPMPDTEQQISAYTGSVVAFPDSNLFSRSALASSVVETEEGSVGGYDVDQGYLVLVPKGYRFSLALEELDQDVDLYLFELDESFQPIGEEPLMTSQNSGISVESVEFDGTQMSAESTLLFIGVDVIGIELSAEVLNALSDEHLSQNATAYSAALYKTPEFWGLHSSFACPAAYDESSACGPETGGTSFYVYGKNFGDWVSVDIGRAAATCSGVLPGESLSEAQTTLELENYDRVYCLSPAAFDDARLQGTAALVVRDSNGAAATAPDSWTYLPPSPSITSLSETSGPKAGGLPLTIQGVSFYVRAGELPGVSFGENAAQVQSINEDGSQLLVYVPACDTCATDTAVDVVVNNPDGQSDTLAGAFTYEEPAGPTPTLSAVTPESGSTEGGVTLTLSGANFTNPMSVALGEIILSDIEPSGTTSLSLTLPARDAAGSVDVQVFNADNQTAILQDGFLYTNPAPSVTQVSPDTGIVAGGQVVTVFGEHFLEGASVTFGDTTAAAVAYISSTVLTVTTPAHAEGEVALQVTNLDGQSGTLTSAFTYTNPSAPAPTLSSASQSSGSTSGGLAVTLTGTNFQTGVQVYFGGTTASSVTYNSATEIVATTPVRAAGTIDVMVLNPDGQSATLNQAFTYAVPAPSITALVPSSGPEAGGTVVVLTGTDFQDGATVSFGSYSATSVQFNSASSMTVSVPTGSAGEMSLILTNPDGQTSTSTYTYVEPTAAAPALYYVEPSTGTYRGGTAVRLEGSDFDTQGAQVFFDGVEATVLSRSETLLEVLSLPGDVGATAVVQVQNGDGQSAGSAFTYTDDEPALGLNRLGPNVGTIDEAQRGVLVVGQGFDAGVTLTVRDTSGGCFSQDVSLSDMVWISASVLVVEMPACTVTLTAEALVELVVQNPDGVLVDLVAQNPDGVEATLDNAYTYQFVEAEVLPMILSVEPAYGMPSVTTTVTVLAENISADAKVMLISEETSVLTPLEGVEIETEENISEVVFDMPVLPPVSARGEIWGNVQRPFKIVNDAGEGKEVEGSFLYLLEECNTNTDCDWPQMACMRAPEYAYKSVCKLGCVVDGSLDSPEQCDGTNLQGLTCADFGFLPEPSGTARLNCSDECTFDTSDCKPWPHCGNGHFEPALGEECDPSVAPGTMGFGQGGISVSTTVDNYLAYCDNYQLGQGQVTCTQGCRLDHSACQNNGDVHCGDGILDGSEFCELGADGNVNSVFAGISNNCIGFERYVSGDPTNPFDAPLTPIGDLGCNALCRPTFAECQPAVCGNYQRDALYFLHVEYDGDPTYGATGGSSRLYLVGEQCDEDNLANLDCGDFGYADGTLACSETTCEFDFSACTAVNASCANGQHDVDSESDVDCGGSCAPCADSKSCDNEHNNCLSNKCVETTPGIYACAPRTFTYADGAYNGRETDTDCGGAGALNEFVTLCALTEQCVLDADCTNDPVQSARRCYNGKCLAQHNSVCADDEADEECISGYCVNGTGEYVCWGNDSYTSNEGGKDLGDSCEHKSECVGEDSVCASHPYASTYKICCEDDCGPCGTCFVDLSTDPEGDQNGNCSPLPNEALATDHNGFCIFDLETDEFLGVVAALHCINGVLDVNETDVDCGGACGATCIEGQWCASTGDCDGLTCDTATGQCAAGGGQGGGD
ncbi:MAG: IPT/TIG domain-containing protein [Myxococcota bacterium]|nr:IPT/TIG domain-containing protein [Myxococcota bacterium]